MKEKIAHYGLRVMADYSSVVFPVGSARFSGAGDWDGHRLSLRGEGKMEITGEVHIEIRGFGSLVVEANCDTSATIVALVSQSHTFSMRFRGEVEGTVKLVQSVCLAHGSSYHERIAASVAGLFDASTTVVHEGPATSDLVSKVVVAEGAKAIVRGRIVMGKGAEGSRGTERIDALLLGAGAEADVLPMLVVDTDDVTCKHAASVGHIDENALFYLTSRGISPAEARGVLTEAFLQFS